ncbi:MAG: hypothetical protein JSW50_05035 [Candidatus Latescibacterota bacterium]|nr:MAG: hypothetical protein JSW50_05035 [Candidatus Latescibacterota bacterium]
MRTRVLGILVIAVFVMTMGVYLGCSKEKTDAETAAEEVTEDTQAAAETPAKETGAELAAYANPEVGVCPVCKMKVEAGYIEVAAVDDKKYACCSAGCVAELAKAPDKYLTAAEEGHEGHDH